MGAVLERFVDEGRCDGVGAGEVGDGARDAHGAVITARGKVKPRGGARQRLLSGGAEAALLIERATCERGVCGTALADTLFGACAGGDDALAHPLGRFAS